MMINAFEREFPRRRSVRLNSYDYSLPGAYFITITTSNRKALFGSVSDDVMNLNEYGQSVQSCWEELQRHFARAVTDAFIVMPNHIHGIIMLTDGRDLVGAQQAVPARGLVRKESFGKPTVASLPTIVRSFKSEATRRINSLRRTPGYPVWQRDYYEHVVRHDAELNEIRQYIFNNPAKWALDRENIASH
jgi:REP element-mobilizing transposase RayT